MWFRGSFCVTITSSGYFEMTEVIRQIVLQLIDVELRTVRYGPVTVADLP